MDKLRMNISTPIVIDLGNVRNAEITELFEGAGQLQEDVNEVLRLVYLNTADKLDNRVFLPVIAVYHLDETSAKPKDTIAKCRRTSKLIRHIVWLE
jgi:hypothetical protein